MSRYRLLIFDLDGTLVDTAPDITEACNHVLRKMGSSPKKIAAVKRAIGKGVHELLEKLMTKKTSAEKLEKGVELFKKYYRDHLVVQTKPFEGVREMLSGPLVDVNKTVVTNKPQDLTMEILERLKLRPYFKEIIGMGSQFPPKPNPAGVEFLLARFAKPSETLMIGDSTVDQITSRQAGIDFAWVSYGYEDILDKEGLKIYSSPREWEDIV